MQHTTFITAEIWKGFIEQEQPLHSVAQICPMLYYLLLPTAFIAESESEKNENVKVSSQLNSGEKLYLAATACPQRCPNLTNAVFSWPLHLLQKVKVKMIKR